MPFLAILGALTLSLAMLFVLPLLGALGGAFSGWVVGWFFSETVLGFLAGWGIKGLAMWQVGLSLGFIGGFFKAVYTHND